MTHDMKLQAKYFDYILHGTKRVELRLNDEKRKLIKVGDVLKFSKLPALTESFEAKVIGLLNYSSFTELFKDFDISILADSSMTKDELLNVLEEFYTPEKQLEFGVLGIRLEVLNV
ncbi:MAG: ASCH domain-containing protein [Clostridia bacterium]